jgi:hypothetical protein
MGMFFILATKSDIETPYRPPFAALTALNTLKSFHDIGNIYNTYDLGGWLIYTFPSSKVFIDGRSPHWNDGINFSPLGFEIAIEHGEQSFAPTFNNFNIHAAFIRFTPKKTHEKDIIVAPFLLRHPQFTAFLLRILSTPSKPELANQLDEAGWCRVYQDQEIVIMLDPQTRPCKSK